MGLLNFLKKKKKAPVDEELDMPPAPPPMQNSKGDSFHPMPPTTKDELPAFPGIKGVDEDISLAPPPADPKERFPAFPEAEKREPKFPPPHVSTPRLFTRREAPPPSFFEPETAEEDMKRPIPPQEIKKEPEPKIENHIFVEVGDFKNSLRGINVVKKDVKKLEGYFKNIHEFRVRNDEEFRKYKSLLEEAEERIKFLDDKIFG